MKKEICEECGERVLKTNIHHKDRNHSNNDPTNLKKLCRRCHGREHGWEGREGSSHSFNLLDETGEHRMGWRLTEGFKLLNGDD